MKLSVDIAIIICLFISPLYSDQVFLVNGDKLTGEIIALGEKKITFETTLIGQISINQEDIETIESDGKVELHLEDGTILNNQILKGANGKILVKDQNGETKQLNLTDITDINPPAPTKPKWKGNVSLGLESNNGNTNNNSISTAISVSKRREKDRILFNYELAKAETRNSTTKEMDKTEDWWKFKGKYDYFLSKKMYLFGEERYEVDKIAQLDRRMVTTGGAGYQFIESDDLNFNTEFGLASVYEKYTDGTDSENELSLQLSYSYDQKIHEKVKLIHELTYNPQLESFSNYLLSTSAELRTFITASMFANAKATLDYDSTPAQSKGATDTKYILGIGWEF